MKSRLDTEQVKGYVGHSLRGLCGLKFPKAKTHQSFVMSQPARAVWIEILCLNSSENMNLSQPARAVWIEIEVYGI